MLAPLLCRDLVYTKQMNDFHFANHNKTKKGLEVDTSIPAKNPPFGSSIRRRKGNRKDNSRKWSSCKETKVFNRIIRTFYLFASLYSTLNKVIYNMICHNNQPMQFNDTTLTPRYDITNL